jgi:hypothetical protein
MKRFVPKEWGLDDRGINRKRRFRHKRMSLRERPKTNLGCASKRFLAPSGGYKNHSHEQKCVRRRSQSQTFTRTRQSGLETKAKQKQCRSSKAKTKKSLTSFQQTLQ